MMLIGGPRKETHEVNLIPQIALLNSKKAKVALAANHVLTVF